MCYSLGDALVIYTLPGRVRPHELKVATLGMLILLQFNEIEAQTKGLTVEQLMHKLNIDEESCRKNLQCLGTSKIKIVSLKREFEAKPIESQEQISQSQPQSDQQMDS